MMWRPPAPAWLALMAAVRGASAADARNVLHPPPRDAASQPAWLAGLRAERDALLKHINYTGAVYSDAAVNWTRLSFVQPQVHLFDRYLYDEELHTYTVDRFLGDLNARYGGIDSVLLWPTYTNIGIDARNQFDYFRALPGGLEALANLTAAFKARGVRVLWAYNPWDQDTRREAEPDWNTLVRLLQQTGGDGFNGDTMVAMYQQYWAAGVDAGYRIVGEMEGGGYPTKSGRPEDTSWTTAEWSPMGWGYFDNPKTASDNITYVYKVAPGIDRFKWLDGRRMTHVCDRWAKNRTDSLQYAFFNGIGYESWENVWGVFMKLSPRDGEALRRVATLLRWLGKEELVQGFATWDPYTPDLSRDADSPYAAGGPMASKFVHANGDCAWLVVNRAASSTTVAIDTSRCPAARAAGYQVYDLYSGAALPSAGPARVMLEAHGYGAVLLTSHPSPALPPLLSAMAQLTRRPLEAYGAQWEPLRQTMVGAADSTARRGKRDAPPGMLLIPKSQYRFRSAGVEIEGGCDLTRDTWGVCCRHPTRGHGTLSCPDDPRCATPCSFAGEDSRGVDVQFPWESVPARFHDQVLDVGPFYIDKHLITKAEYARYLNVSGYRPRDPYNFLVGWLPPRGTESWRPAAGEWSQPVVWVSLSEAREYCRWAGKRLPHAYEWQLAAQGTDGRIYPWGNSTEGLDGGGATPRRPGPSSGPRVQPLPDVGAFSPAGDSPFGVADLVGIVWQFLDEFRDEHTRTVIVKGSSLYEPMLSSKFPSLPQVGNWYFPKALEVDRHNRMMLMDDSYERAATLGFRCVADHIDGMPGPYHARAHGAQWSGADVVI